MTTGSPVSPEVRFVDVTYRGLKVAARAKLVESAPGDAFVEIDAPLPVGTALRLLGGEAPLDVRVAGVVEQEAGAKSPPGMHVVWGAAAEPDTSDSLEPGSSGSVPPVGDSSEPAAGGGEGRRRRRRGRGRS